MPFIMIKNSIVRIVLVKPKTDSERESPFLDRKIVVRVEGIPICKTKRKTNCETSLRNYAKFQWSKNCPQTQPIIII